MKATLAIGIPVYNNLAQCAECLASLSKQSKKDFDVYLFDDCSNVDYKMLLASYPNLCIQYVRNKKNIGSLANMKAAYDYLKNHFQFVMVLHEDDLIDQYYVAAIYKAIQHQPLPAFIISHFKTFDANQPIATTSNHYQWNTQLMNRTELAFALIKGAPMAFGSVVYNTDLFTHFKLDLNTYAEFCDRPFLLNALTADSLVAVIETPLYYYRSHGMEDKRWKKLLPLHVFNLLRLYHRILVDSKYLTTPLFKRYATRLTLESYQNLTLAGSAPAFPKYLMLALSKGWLSLKYALFRIPIVNKYGSSFKKLIA